MLIILFIRRNESLKNSKNVIKDRNKVKTSKVRFTISKSYLHYEKLRRLPKYLIMEDKKERKMIAKKQPSNKEW